MALPCAAANAAIASPLPSWRPPGRVAELGSLATAAPLRQMTAAFSVRDDEKFKRYLVGEWFWELEQHRPIPEPFVGVAPESVEVLGFSGYDDMRIRIAGKVYDVHLSWKKAEPPTVVRV